MGPRQSRTDAGNRTSETPAKNLPVFPICVSFMERGIRGIAAAGDKLFVIGLRYNDAYAKVYVRDNPPEPALYPISVDTIKSPRSLVDCSYNKTLYIGDQALNCIHRVNLITTSVTRWMLRESHEPQGLSVTAEHTLLVTVWIRGTRAVSTVMEYTSEGQLLREIRLDRSVDWAWQTVQLSISRFIVSHGGSSLHRICAININGQIIKSYGRERGVGEGQLWKPCSIALDEKKKRLFVADHGNHRVLMLDTDLNYLGQLHTPPYFSRPSNLYFNPSSDQLFVDSNDSLLSPRSITAILQHNRPITGISVVDSKIYVVQDRNSKVNVYDSHSLAASPDINIPDMKSPQSLAGCSYNTALYIGDQALTCIHIVNLITNFVTRWKMRETHEPWDLSVTTEHTLLVTVWVKSVPRDESRVIEYTSEGQQVREIKFNRSIEWAWHTVQLSSNQLIVCHGCSSLERHSSLHRVCVINTEGQTVESYGREKGASDGQLDRPCSLALDYNAHQLFVADCDNDRVLMLDIDLTCLGQVHTPRDLENPCSLYFDSTTDRLFVGELSGRLLVISPPPIYI